MPDEIKVSFETFTVQPKTYAWLEREAESEGEDISTWLDGLANGKHELAKYTQLPLARHDEIVPHGTDENPSMPTNPVTLADALPKEIKRCRDLLKQYEAIGSAGQFGFIMISQDIANAEQAITEGDVVAMLRAYTALKDCQ